MPGSQLAFHRQSERRKRLGARSFCWLGQRPQSLPYACPKACTRRQPYHPKREFDQSDTEVRETHQKRGLGRMHSACSTGPNLWIDRVHGLSKITVNSCSILAIRRLQHPWTTLSSSLIFSLLSAPHRRELIYTNRAYA